MTFLELEDADPGAHMHLGALLLLDPPIDEPEPGDLASRVRELLLARVARLPRLAEHLDSPSPRGLRRPRWTADERFDVDHHLRRAALPSPGGRRELEAWCGEFFGRRIDRGHPLWEVVVLEGLDDGRWALATKLHHCLADGIGSLDIAAVLFAGEDELDDGTRPSARPTRPSPLARLTRLPFELAGAGLGTLRHPRRVGGTVHSALATAELLGGELAHRPLPALSVPLGAQRRFATVTVPMRDLRAIEHELGGTINDTVLAIVAGALRRWLRSRDRPMPRGRVRAMVPVGAHHAAPEPTGNRISSLFIDLPVDVATAQARHAAVRRATAARKRAGQASGSSTVLGLAELLPPVLHQPLVRLVTSPRLFDLTVTNIAGPERPIHVVGSVVREIHPLVPLAPDRDLGVAVVSHAGSMTFGVVADFDAVPDLDQFIAGIREQHVHLRHLATTTARTPVVRGDEPRLRPVPRVI